MNAGRCFHSLTMLANGYILALGGLDRDFRELCSAEIFDLNTNTWIAVPSMSVVRSDHTATRFEYAELCRLRRQSFSGLVWLNGTWNGSPFSPRMLTFLYDAVNANLCFPIVTTNDQIAVICI